jgi:quinol monooxygenase YgiN
MIIITGSIIAKADRLEDMITLSLEHVRRSRSEPGCVAHTVHQDLENPLRLVFVEEWSDRAAVAAHFAVPASRAFVKAATQMAAEPAMIHIYEAATTDI